LAEVAAARAHPAEEGAIALSRLPTVRPARRRRRLDFAIEAGTVFGFSAGTAPARPPPSA
jgi:hypothetical protein